MKRTILSLLLLLMVTPAVHGQVANSSGACHDRVQRTMSQNRVKAVREALAFDSSPVCMMELILDSPQFQHYASPNSGTVLEALKGLTQLGSSSGSTGTPDLVSKGLGAQLFAAAAQYGALTESNSNETVTISGSLGGVPTSLMNHAVLGICDGGLVGNRAMGECVTSKTLRALNRISYGVSFDTSQNHQALNGTASGQGESSTQPVVFTPNTQQVSQILAKVVIIPGNPVSPQQFVQNVTKDINSKTSISVLQTQMDNAAKPLTDWQAANSTAFLTWQNAALALLAANDAGTTDATVLAAWDSFPVREEMGACLVQMMGGGTASECRLDAVTDYLQANRPPAAPDIFGTADTFTRLFFAWEGVQFGYAETLLAKPVLTFEYDDNRPPGQPSNSVFRLILGKSFSTWTLTANAAASIYNSAPASSIPGASRLRDIQIAGEADYDLKKWLGSGSSTGLAYYFQDQTSPAIVNVDPSNPADGVTFVGLPSTAKQVFAQKGIINIAQAKLTFGLSQRGISFPVAVSWANRTELIAKPAWRAQVGFYYNFDALISAKSPK